MDLFGDNPKKQSGKIIEKFRIKMKIQTITVTAGRTFNHPHESYSNLRPEVVLTATLDDSDDPTEATKKLQTRAEGLVEDHKQMLLKSIEELWQLTERQAEMRGLRKQLSVAQDRLDAIRREHPQLALSNES